MHRTRYYTAMSLDGFLATSDHSLDWLTSRDQDEHGVLNYGAFIAGIGALCMGANTYQWVCDHLDGPWPYDLPTWVVTHRSFPARRDDADIRFVALDAEALHAEMSAAAGEKDLWVVGGGELAGRFADAGLLDELIVYLAPVTLGAGAPLLPRRLELRLAELGRNREFACARYDVVKA